jgi:3-oxoadipate enol-lactonase
MTTTTAAPPADQAESVASPRLPPGRSIHLPGRGTTFIREMPAPKGAPTLFLLHGWTVTADLNWFTMYEGLNEHYGILAMDHRGHGQGIRPGRRQFRLTDCADDAAAVVQHLGLDRVVPVGYSMGGPIAQLMWHRHPERVAGLVLCATASVFARRRSERAWFGAMGAAARLSRVVGEAARRKAYERLLVSRVTGGPFDHWIRGELAAGDPRLIMEAGPALARFDSRSWLPRVDVPSAVVVTEKDEIVSPYRQRALVNAIPGASLHAVTAHHDSVVADADRFRPTLLDACRAATT